jgi:chorismate mutase
MSLTGGRRTLTGGGARVLKTKKLSKSYIVREDILPEAILKTAQVKEMLTRGDALTVNEAVERAGLSRSAFYKYRDGVVPYTREEKEKVTAITLLLEHRSGVLSNVLNAVAAMKGNIVSINQSMPVQGVAVATMNVNTTLIKDIGSLAENLQAQEGVKKVEVLT